MTSYFGNSVGISHGFGAMIAVCHACGAYSNKNAAPPAGSKRIRSPRDSICI